MLNPQLHAALAAFVEEAAWQLASDAAQGAEVPFEVVEGGGRRDTPLYCYRPLTGDFIDERISILGGLPTYLAAVHALAACRGVDSYLVDRGESHLPPDARSRAEEALRHFLARVFEDSTDFTLVPERLASAYTELEGIVMEGRTDNEVVAALLGLTIASDELALGDGLTLVRGETCGNAPAEALRMRTDGHVPVLVRLRWEAAPGDEEPLRHARVSLRRLLTALRLYDAAPVAFGPTAWTRDGGGPWEPFALGQGPWRARGVCAVPPLQEDELRAFCALVARRTPRDGELAWALRRFELGCERVRASEALTDVLLSLRALLEPEGAHSGRLAGRVAALCALPERQGTVTERVAHIVALERAIVAGSAPGEAAIEPLVDELAGWLRALLRDVLCGHLDSDLRTTADQLIEESAVRAQQAPA